jgi:hypothetical protein
MSKSARTLTVAAVLTLLAVAMPPGAPGAAKSFLSGTESEPQPMPSDPLTDVSAPALSYTGRYVAHLAIRRDQASPRQQLRRTDFRYGGSELVNPSIDGGVAAGNYSRPPVISADGSRVSFTSTATRLVENDTNDRSDAFVRDATADITLLASVAFDGDAANGDTGMASLSKSGQHAVFTSSATDVVPGSTTPNADVYLRDLGTKTTVQVTVRPDGSPSRGPGSTSTDVSANGNLVAFNSYNTDLARTDSADQEADLFIRNMTTGRTRWLSAGLPVGANPSGVVISPNGRWVSSRWDDGSLHMTRVDTGVTSTVVTDGYALLGAFSSQLGRFVFVSAGGPYVRDLSTGVDTPIKVPDGGSVTAVTISGNGLFAAYDWIPDDGGPSRIFRVAL